MLLEIPSIKINNQQLMDNFKLNFVKGNEAHQFRTKFDIMKGDDKEHIDLVCHSLQVNIPRCSIHMKGIELHRNHQYEMDVIIKVTKKTILLKGNIDNINVNININKPEDFKQFLELFVN